MVASRLSCFIMRFASLMLVRENGEGFEEVPDESEEERYRETAEILFVSLYFSWKLAL